MTNLLRRMDRRPKWNIAPLLLFVLSAGTPLVTQAFSSPQSPLSLARPKQHVSSLHAATNVAGTNDADASGSSKKTLNVVLFGVGDLRFHDHGGLEAALASAKAGLGDNKILPLVVLDQKDILPNIPGAVVSTKDTAAMLSSSLESLSHQLEKNVGLPLHVQVSSEGVVPSLLNLLRKENNGFDVTTLHVCDLGNADNDMKYGAYAHLKEASDSLWEKHAISVQTWNCNLRPEPWEALESLPTQYPDYVQQYVQSRQPLRPVMMDTREQINGMSTVSIPTLQSIPTSDQLVAALQQALQRKDDDEEAQARLEMEQFTGLYATHWGGMDNAQLSEEEVLQGISAFLEGNGDDAALVQSSWWKQRKLHRNPRSLEHATLEWLMQKKPQSDNAAVETQNLMEGELLTRYLAAPLLYGVVSPRTVWHMAQEAADQAPLWNRLWGKQKAVLQPLVEGREWHRLFAARTLACGNEEEQDAPVQIGFWRYHGFLCRYGYSPQMNQATTTNDEETSDTKTIGQAKRGLVLVHGFGASGSQFYKTIKSLRQSLSSSSSQTRDEAFVLDLLGFGQSEKPTLSYNQYLWSGFTDAFIKEFCLLKRECDSYIVSGNSIGGYTAMSTAADDVVVPVTSSTAAAATTVVSGTGAPGSGKCQGLVLMNSAGRILTPEMVEEAAAAAGRYRTFAEMTATLELPPGNPPPRGLATVGGKALLWYLRPRIREICSSVYPVNPQEVQEELCRAILRDSLDPGAISVMVSGSKLPPPRTANELLSADYGSARQAQDLPLPEIAEGQWQGPVLLANGQLDPLNDCVERTDKMSDFRSGITVERLRAGHCPHDEVPQEMARAIVQWMQGLDQETRNKVTGTTTTTATGEAFLS